MQFTCTTISRSAFLPFSPSLASIDFVSRRSIIFSQQRLRDAFAGGAKRRPCAGACEQLWDQTRLYIARDNGARRTSKRQATDLTTERKGRRRPLFSGLSRIARGERRATESGGVTAHS